MNLSTLPRLYPEEPLEEPDERLPDVRLPARGPAVCWLAGLSGVVSNAAVWADVPAGLWYLPGVIFGLAVLLPWCVWCGVGRLQTLACVLLAPVGYAAAVYTLYRLPPFAGLIGCVITFAPVWVACHPKVRGALLQASVVGFFLGLPFLIPFLALFGAIAVWQVGVGIFLSLALEREP